MGKANAARFSHNTCDRMIINNIGSVFNLTEPVFRFVTIEPVL